MTDTAVIAALKRIASENGGELKPEDVVEAARPDDSPLHSKFEWDDSEAARQHRIWQARQLIRVTVCYVGPENKTPMRVFVSLTPDRKNEGGGYRATAEVLSSPKLRDQLLSDALDEFKRFREKYESLKELSEVFAAMKAAERRLLKEDGFLAA